MDHRRDRGGGEGGLGETQISAGLFELSAEYPLACLMIVPNGNL